MSAVLFRLRAELRTRWPAWLGLALLVGCAGGAVTATAAGADRTATAYERFMDAQRAPDVLMYVACDEDDPLDVSCLTDVRTNPAIAESAIVYEYPEALVTTVDGTVVEEPSDPCYSGPGDMTVLADPDGNWGHSIERHRIIEGRAADPTRADEAVISESLAERADLRPGDTVLVTAPNPECADEELLAEFPPTTTEFRVVGVQRAPYEIVPASGFYISSLLLTPAWFADASADRFQRHQVLAARLAPGHSAGDVIDAVEAAGGQVEPVPIDDMRSLPGESIEPYSTSLSASAIVALLAVLAVLFPVLVRRLRLDAAEQPALWALGMSRRDLRVLTAIRAAVVAALSAVATAMVAIAASVFFPIGPARELEPDAGLDADWSFVALGAIATAVLVLVAAGPALLVRVHGVPRSPVRRGLLAGRGARLPVPAWCGVRLAFARSTAAVGGVVAVWVAVVALVGALTFSAGVQHLLATPRLVGMTWDVGLGFPAADPEFPADDVRERIADHPDVEGFAEATIWSAISAGNGAAELGPDGVEAAILGFDAAGVEPALISGRVPTAPDEVALGPKTLDALDLSEGDEVDVHGYEGAWGDEPVPTEAKYRIVGTVVMLAQDNKGLGHGALLTLDGLKRLNSYSGADVAWLRLAPGTDLRALARDIYPGEDMEVEEAYLDFDSLSLDLSRSGIGRVDSAPVVLAGLLGVLGLGVLLQLVVSATFRNRRPLAVLGVLGLGRAQVRSTVRWQAIAYTFLPVLFGVPVGVALGRTIFYGYASRLGAVPEPVTPVLAVVVLVPLAFALAIATALIPGWRAARRNAAAALRAE